MEKNEFRIGNLVSNKKGEIIEIKSIDEIGINIEENLTQDIGYFLTHQFSLSEIKPISLTNSIMESNGFYENIPTALNNNLYIYFKEKSLNVYSVIIEEYELTQVKYYHELQNIWKSITGEELNQRFGKI